jgi:hypothetical protein
MQVHNLHALLLNRPCLLLNQPLPASPLLSQLYNRCVLPLILQLQLHSPFIQLTHSPKLERQSFDGLRLS